MARVLISHVAADAVPAGQLADALRAAGFDVSSGAALQECDAIVLLASPEALASEQLTTQVVAGYERGVPVVPVLLGVTHLDLTTRQPAWRSAIGSATTVEVPAEGVPAIADRVVEGVRALTAPVPRRARASDGAGSGRRLGLVAGAAVVVLALIAGVWWATAGDGDGETAGPTGRPTSSASASPSPTATDSTAVLDSGTTPVKSVAGRLRITQVRMVQEFCAGPAGDDCARAKGSNRVVVLKVVGWDGANLEYTEDFAREMDRAYVQSGEETAGFVKANQSFDHSTWEIAYIPLPDSAVDAEVLLRWPGNPTILLHPVEG